MHNRASKKNRKSLGGTSDIIGDGSEQELAPETLARLKLREAGFDPVPLSDKGPRKKEWQTLVGASAEEIESWDRTLSFWPGTGIISKRTPGVDVDITIPEAVDAVVALVRHKFAGRGKIIRRIGRPPKCLIPFRTDEPYPKKTLKLFGPGGSKQVVEILANGQQFASYGKHPELGTNFQWPDGYLGDVTRDELPELSSAEADELLEEISEMLRDEYDFRGNSFSELGDQPTKTRLESMTLGVDVHDTILSVSASLLSKGMADDQVVQKLMRLTRKNLGNKADKWDWEWEENRIRGMVDDFHKKQAKAEAEAKAAGILLSPNKIDWGRKAKAKLWPTLRYWREDYYVFCDGAYKAIDDEVVEAEVTLVLEQAKMKIKGTVVSFDAKKSNVAEAMQALRVTSIIPPGIEAGSWIDGATGPTDVIVFPNGRLDLATNQLSPPDPRFFATSTLGFDWGEDEPGMPVNFLAFLKQIFDGDQEQINLVLEMIGYCLTTDGSLQKAFLILGPKRSGKGTLLRVIEALLGQNKIHAMPLKKFGQTFGLQGAINKRLILISDARVVGRQDQNAMVENILKITGQDPISIDRKYKDDWFGRLQAKILAMSNIMPKVGDDSGVIATRFVHIQTKVSFFGREDLTLFDEKLKPELPAILHLCIKALKKLRQRGRFLQTIAGAEAQEEMAELSNPIEIFVKEKCVLDQNETIPKDDLYQTYTGWTDENNEFTLPKSQFFAALYASFPDELKVVRPRSPTPGPRPAVIHGIALIQLPPSEDGDGSRLNNLSPADRPPRGRHRTGQGGRGHHRDGQGGEPE